MPVSFFLAEDHQIVRQGLRALLEAEGFHFAGDAKDGLETLRLVPRLNPEVLLLDLMMPDVNGLEVARQLRKAAPRTAIIILSMNTDPAYVAAAMQAGAAAYVFKEANSAELVQTIRKVLTRQYGFLHPLTPEVLQDYLRKAQASPLDPFETLTPRERLVLELTAEGLSSIEVGQRLHISPRTVESHRANLLRKLSVRNLKELIRLALQHGILPQGPGPR
jgi:two-component system response regulator NreC